MTKILSESTISECQAKFNLKYQVPLTYWCQQLVGFKGKDVLEVGGSLPQEFVFDYLNVKTWSALESPDYEVALEEIDGDYRGSNLYKINDYSNFGFKNRALDNYNFFAANIEDLPNDHYQKYELVFSISAFEHIHKFPLALEKMFLALKPGGQLFAVFSPIWSAHDGHHLPPVTEPQGRTFDFHNSPIPPWGHLLMKPPELCRYLYQLTDKETADLIVYYVYNSHHINRFFTEDYLEFIKQSSFTINRLELIGLVKPAPKTQEHLEKLHLSRSLFSNNGILTVLEKPLNERSKSIVHTQVDLPTQLSDQNNQALDIKLDLRELNFIIFPDWQQPEELIYQDLRYVISTLIKTKTSKNLSLLIDTRDITEEEASLILSDILMNLLMEKDIDTSKEPTISLLGNLNSQEWEALLPQLNGRILIERENQQAIANARAELMPTVLLDSLGDIEDTQNSENSSYCSKK